VFDDDDRVAGVDEPVEHVDQLALVLLVKPRCRLVEQVEGVARRLLPQFLGELLRAGPRRRRAW